MQPGHLQLLRHVPRLHVYTIQTGSVNAGSSLDHTTAKSYWSGIINRANVKWNVPGACDAALQVREPAR